MEIFVEQASSYDKCLKKIRQKYGDDAIIIRQKDAKVSWGLFGLFERDSVEITFALNEHRDKLLTPSFTPAAPKPLPPQNDDEERLKIVKGYAEKNPEAAQKLRPHVDNIQKKISKQAVSESGGSVTRTEQDEAIEKLTKTIERLTAKIDKQTAPVQQEAEHTHIKKIQTLLEENDFSLSYIKELCIRLKNELTYNDIENFQTVQNKLFDILAESVVVMPAGMQPKTRIILLVGPTGVGKTTTLAKLLAYYYKKAKRLKAITIDSWRIGAAQQLEKYCEIMDIPSMCASTPLELRKYMDISRGESDVICIDTTGRSPNDHEKLAQMQEYFAELGDDAEIYLTLCADTRLNDMREIMKQYAIFNYKSLIITKFDETSYVGNLFSIMAEKKIPVTYVTTGQAVPQDFVQADAEMFLKKLQGFSVGHGYIEQICSKKSNYAANS